MKLLSTFWFIYSLAFLAGFVTLLILIVLSFFKVLANPGWAIFGMAFIMFAFLSYGIYSLQQILTIEAQADLEKGKAFLQGLNEIKKGKE